MKQPFVKFGTPAQRKAAADLMREIRSMWDETSPAMDRRDWNHRVMQAGHNHIAFLRKFNASVKRLPMEEIVKLRRIK